MTLPIPTLDHVVVNVRDRMDEAQALYQRLGFTLTPRGRHTLGSINHLAMFGTAYLELIGVDAGGAGRTDLLGWPAGLNGLVFGTEDSAAVHAALTGAGVASAPPGEFSRPVALPGGAEDAVFRTVRLPNDTTPAGRLYFCHHFSRHLVWRDEWRGHANGTVGVLQVVIAAAAPERLGALFRRMFGTESVRAIAGGLRLVVGLSDVDIVTPAEVGRRFGDAAPADGRDEYMAALVLRTRGLDAAAAALRVPDVRQEARRVLVPAAQTMGVVLEFREQTSMNPVLVEATRGTRVESAHVGAAVAVDAGGAVVFAAGDIDTAVYPRSAVKALLALPMVESGAADRLGLSEAEIALACSSHSGEAVHVAAAASMLGKAGRDVSCLECGTHWPGNEAASRRLAAAGEQPTALHNNCSGKHSGFICLACDRGDDPAGYVRPEHPTMRVITAALADMTGTVLDESNRAIDGCSIPTHAIPLRALAHAFARFGSGRGMDPARSRAAVRIRAAVAANPLMVAGTGRFDTRLMTALGAQVFSKGGAEGVWCAAIPEQGLGLAVKCQDGAGRASEVAMAALLGRFLRPEGEAGATLAALAGPVLRNWNGIEIGRLRPAGPLPPFTL